MADLQKIVDDLSTLTVIEAADLARLLGKEVGRCWKRVWNAGSVRASRTDLGPRPLRRGEALFDFYDTCASPGYDEFRSVVNSWGLAQMPASDRAELITRMRYGGDREFGASLSELSLHAFIVGSGCRASPTSGSPGRFKLREPQPRTARLAVLAS